MKKSIFLESFENHQKLVDILWSHKNAEGICVVPEEELLSHMNRSMGWVKKAINRINTEDLCIEVVGRNKYIVHYHELAKRGVFSTIIKMMLITCYDVEILHWKNETLMQMFGCGLKTVQMYRAYCTTGWIQGTKDMEIEDAKL